MNAPRSVRTPHASPRLAGQRGALGGIPETVIALALGVMFVAAVVMLGNRAFESGEVSKAQANLNMIAVGTRTLYATRNTYGAGNLDQLLQFSGAVPRSMWSDQAAADGNILNVWAQDVTVTAAANRFHIVYQGVPRHSCIELLARTPSDEVETVETTTGGPLVPVVTPFQAETACSDPNANQITWVYR